MASGLYFDYATITGRRQESDTQFHAGPAQALARSLREDGLPRLEAIGGRFYGLWIAQFGLASNQLVLMTSWDRQQGVSASVEETLSSLEAVECIDHQLVVPTARPETPEPPRRPGTYVHRWFDVAPRNVDEIVELSAAAWETFESTFEVEVIGFFLTLVEPSADSTQLMLLNWYPSLAAWEASRNFGADPASKRNFLRRAELTSGTRAITTTLVT